MWLLEQSNPTLINLLFILSIIYAHKKKTKDSTMIKANENSKWLTDSLILLDFSIRYNRMIGEKEGEIFLDWNQNYQLEIIWG